MPYCVLSPSRFLFHGDGKAIAMDSQSSQSTYDVPRCLASVYSQPHSGAPSRPAITTTCSKSQDHDSGIYSLGSSKTPPTLDGPPVRLDKHPSIRRKRDSDPCVFRRSNSTQLPCISFNDKEISDPMFDDEGSLSRRTSHSDSPPDESEGYVTGHMDGDSTVDGRLYDVVKEGRGSDGHPFYIPRATETEDEYVHPKYRNDGYIFMRRANSPQKSSTIPVPMPQPVGSSDEYNTLQHFQGRQSALRATNSVNYETLPTIVERQAGRGDNYENHPLPQDLKCVVPRNYQPSYENHKGAFRG